MSTTDELLRQIEDQIEARDIAQVVDLERQLAALMGAESANKQVKQLLDAWKARYRANAMQSKAPSVSPKHV